MPSVLRPARNCSAVDFCSRWWLKTTALRSGVTAAHPGSLMDIARLHEMVAFSTGIMREHDAMSEEGNKCTRSIKKNYNMMQHTLKVEAEYAFIAAGFDPRHHTTKARDDNATCAAALHQ